MADLKFWTLMANYRFWTKMADFEFWTLVDTSGLQLEMPFCLTKIELQLIRKLFLSKRQH